MNEAWDSVLNEVPSMFLERADGLTGNVEGLAITRWRPDYDNLIWAVTS